MRMGPLFINQQSSSKEGASGATPTLLLQATPIQTLNKTLTLQSNGSGCSSDSGHTSGNFDAPQQTTTGGGGGGDVLKKYLLLLQDCLVIKFVQVGEGPHPSQGFSFAFHGGQMPEGEDHTHSLGFSLFKELLSCNLKCYWNGALCEAIGELEYKGYLVPSTIMVWALPPSLALVRTAWGRKMLRSPQGYAIQFIGELEEMIAEPVSQGQFAPLSDSLCWVIQELTSSGQEAFVDSILFSMGEYFPLMSLPPRELVYQTLEILIRERKVYQTSNGYFIVTPDTFRYMSAGGGGGSAGDHYSQPHPPQAPLDALITSYYHAPDKMSQNSSWELSGSGDDLLVINDADQGSPLKRHNSLKVIRQRDLDTLSPTMGARSLSFRISKTKSLLIGESLQDDKEGGPIPENVGDAKNGKVVTTKEEKSSKKISFFRRLFSFRRGRSTPNVSKTGKNVPAPEKPTLTPTCPVKPEKSSTLPLESLQRSPKIYAQLPHRLQNDQGSQGHRSYEDILEDEVNFSGRSNNNGGKMVPMSKWNSLPSRSSGRRSGRSQSRRSILTESPFYDVLNFQSSGRDVSHQKSPSRASSSLGYQSQTQQSQGHQSHQGHQGQGQRRPQSLYSVGSGLQIAQRSQRIPSRIDSPSPSQSVSAIYASIGNSGKIKSQTQPRPLQGQQPHPPVTLRGRGRYPPPWRPRSAYELLAYQTMQREKEKKDSLPKVTKPKNPEIPKNPENGSTVTSIKSNSFISTSTELQVQIPLGKLVSSVGQGRENNHTHKTTSTKLPTRKEDKISCTITTSQKDS